MATKIEWTQGPDGSKGMSWNPIKMRCTKVSEGCQKCYAERLLSRNLPGFKGYPELGQSPRLNIDELTKPRRWKKPRRIFVESMGDLFHEDVSDFMLLSVLEVIDTCRDHTFLLLTKRPLRMKSKLSNWLFPNLWLGVTAENQRTADERIPILLQIPAAVRFVSVEPCLSNVDLTPYLETITYTKGDGGRKGFRWHEKGLDWVICGAETGQKPRRMETEWATDLMAQCQAAGVPFFFKKWGNLYREEGILMPREFPKGD